MTRKCILYNSLVSNFSGNPVNKQTKLIFTFLRLENTSVRDYNTSPADYRKISSLNISEHVEGILDGKVKGYLMRKTIAILKMVLPWTWSISSSKLFKIKIYRKNVSNCLLK